MYVSCNFIEQNEGNILLWHMTLRVTILLLSPSHFFSLLKIVKKYLSSYMQAYRYKCYSSAG